MNQNPLLLATLFLKHQPAAKSFEEAVAMEVESLKAEWASIDNELNALAAKERELSARKHQLMDTRRELLGDDKAGVVSEPAKMPVNPLPSLLQLASRTTVEKPAQTPVPPITLEDEAPRPRMRCGKGTQWRKRADGSMERKYDSWAYHNIAKSGGMGTLGRDGIVWLTPDEHPKVIALLRRRVAVPVSQSQQDAAMLTRRANRDSRIRQGTDITERSYSGREFARFANTVGKGSPGIGCVWLSDQEADEYRTWASV